MSNLAEMERELAELQARVTAERARVRTEALAAIKDMLASGTLQPDDLRELLPAAEQTPRRERGNKPPKYRDPATGQTWTGQGATPKWLRDVPESQRDAYLITQEAA